MAHQSLDTATAYPAALGLQLLMDAWAAIASIGVAIDPLDVADELMIGGRAPALRARAPGIITGWRYSGRRIRFQPPTCDRKTRSTSNCLAQPIF